MSPSFPVSISFPLCKIGFFSLSAHITGRSVLGTVKYPSLYFLYVLIPGVWKEKQGALCEPGAHWCEPGAQWLFGELQPGDCIIRTDVPRSGSTCQEKGVVS